MDSDEQRWRVLTNRKEFLINWQEQKSEKKLNLLNASDEALRRVPVIKQMIYLTKSNLFVFVLKGFINWKK